MAWANAAVAESQLFDTLLMSMNYCVFCALIVQMWLIEKDTICPKTLTLLLHWISLTGAFTNEANSFLG